jgi:hypothetical protein
MIDKTLSRQAMVFALLELFWKAGREDRFAMIAGANRAHRRSSIFWVWPLFATTSSCSSVKFRVSIPRLASLKVKAASRRTPRRTSPPAPSHKDGRRERCWHRDAPCYGGDGLRSQRIDDSCRLPADAGGIPARRVKEWDFSDWAPRAQI